MQQERARDVCMAVCYHLRYSSTSCSRPVREIQEFEGPEESQANTMADDEDPGAGGGTFPPLVSRGATRRGSRTSR